MSGTGRRERSEIPEAEEAAQIRQALLRIAHMFGEYRNDDLMRELCRLSIKAAQERLIRV